MKVKIFTLCENAFFDENNRQSVIAAFDKVNMDQTPGAVIKISLAGSMIESERNHKYNLSVEFVDSQNNLLTNSMEFEKESSDQGTFAFVINIPVLEVKSEGKFKFLLKSNGVVLAECPLLVVVNKKVDKVHGKSKK